MARSVFALEAWDSFQRLYLGTLTKPFATGLKIGFAHASDAGLLDRMIWLKGHHDFGSAHFNQAVLEHVLEVGDFDAHLGELRPAYAAKMVCLNRALEAAGLRHLGWDWKVPDGGLYLWLRAPEGIGCGGTIPPFRVTVAEIDEQIGDSLLVVGDETALKVHVHTDDPGAALSAGVAMGVVEGVEIANMHVQTAVREERLPGDEAARDLGSGL